MWCNPQKYGREGGINGETGIDIYTVLYIKQIINNNLQYGTRNSTQYSVMVYMGKQPIKRLDECVCATDSLCYTTETNTVDQPNSNNLFLYPEGKKF